MRNKGSSFFSFSSFCCCYSVVVLLALVSLPSAVVMAEGGATSAGSGHSGVPKVEGGAVHIVYMERPGDVEPEAHHIRTLAAVVGSEEAAKEALVYSYKTAASGFSAKLTPQQVSEISKQPGVLQVVPSRTFQLHPGPTKFHV